MVRRKHPKCEKCNGMTEVVAWQEGITRYACKNRENCSKKEYTLIDH